MALKIIGKKRPAGIRYYEVRGDTFSARFDLDKVGAVWVPSEKYWKLPASTAKEDIETLRRKNPGLAIKSVF